MPGRAKGESMADDPEKVNEFRQGLIEMRGKIERGEPTGLNRLQPEFLLTILDLEGLGEVSPLQQERLRVYFTTEMSEVEMAREEGKSDDAIQKSNRRALEVLYQYLVMVSPEKAEQFPRERVLRGKNPGYFGAKHGIEGGRPIVHGRYSKRVREEDTQDREDTTPTDNTPTIEEA